jgi:hypothetical protein
MIKGLKDYHENPFRENPDNNSDLIDSKKEGKIIDNKPNLPTTKLVRLGNDTAS